MVGTPHILVKRGVLNFHFVKRGSRLLKKEGFNMSQYTDFDLDIRRSASDSIDGDPMSVLTQSDICTTITQMSYCGCSGNCTIDYTAVGNCPTVASCSECHSYCGAACR